MIWIGKTHFLWTLYFGNADLANLKLQQNSVNQIFNPCAFFFFLSTGATWYYHAIYIVFAYFPSFTGYRYDIVEVISNLHIQGSKFGGKFYKFGGKSFKKFNSADFMEFFFSKSASSISSVRYHCNMPILQTQTEKGGATVHHTHPLGEGHALKANLAAPQPLHILFK